MNRAAKAAKPVAVVLAPVRLVAIGLESTPANDVTAPTAQDVALASLEAEWTRMHRRAFRGASMRLTVYEMVELTTVELILVHGPRRVTAERVEVTEMVPSRCYSFLFPL